MQPTLLKLDNFPSNNLLESSYLDADADAAATTLVLKSAQAFAQNYFVLVGTPAQENTEMRQISAISGVNLTVPALSRKHKKYDAVLLLAANKLQVYRATAPSDGSQPAVGAFAAYGDPIDIDYDQLTTRYVDNDGGSGYWYGYTFVNSVTMAATELADSQFIRGGSISDYATIDEIREEAGIENNPYISDVYVQSKRTLAEGIINDMLKGHYDVPFTAPIPPTIRQITILLAAGYILKREYGSGSNGTTSNGTAKIKEANNTDPKNLGLLQQILNGTINLGGSTPGVDTARPRVRGWPNASTETTRLEDGGSRRKIRSGMKF